MAAAMKPPRPASQPMPRVSACAAGRGKVGGTMQALLWFAAQLLRQPAVEHPVGVEHLLNDDTRPGEGRGGCSGMALPARCVRACVCWSCVSARQRTALCCCLARRSPLVELEALRASRGTRGRVSHQRPGLAASASGRAQGGGPSARLPPLPVPRMCQKNFMLTPEPATGRPRGGMKVAARIGERLRREIGRGRLPRVGDG